MLPCLVVILSKQHKKRFTHSAVERVKNFYNPYISVENKNAFDVISQAEEDILFLDTPYLLESSTLYGVKGDTHKSFDHKSFYDVVTESQKPFVLTYNNHPDIRCLWKNYNQVETSWAYGMNSSKKSSELIIYHGVL